MSVTYVEHLCNGIGEISGSPGQDTPVPHVTTDS